MNDIDASEITPGLALAAAELFHMKKPDELSAIAAAVDSPSFSASSIQLVLSVIDWIAMNQIGDEIATAYENDDKEELERLHTKGARFEITPEGTLNSWMQSENGNPIAFDFPLEFWTDFKFAVQSRSNEAATTLDLPVEAMKYLTSGLINDGIIQLLSGVDEVTVPSAVKFFREDTSRANYAVVASNAFITAAAIEVAVKSRNDALMGSIPDMEPITYEDIAGLLREQLLEQ